MQQRQIVSGFSDLKDLLIKTYQMEKNRELVRLYFSEEGDDLLLHDYDDHKKVIVLSSNIQERALQENLTAYARDLVQESFNHVKPSKFLNDGFTLYGFFRF